MRFEEDMFVGRHRLVGRYFRPVVAVGYYRVGFGDVMLREDGVRKTGSAVKTDARLFREVGRCCDGEFGGMAAHAIVTML